MVEKPKEYCVRACPECPVAHVADGGIAVTNTYAGFGDALTAEARAIGDRPAGMDDPDNRTEFLEVASGCTRITFAQSGRPSRSAHRNRTMFDGSSPN